MKKMFKKVVSFTLATALAVGSLFSLASCGDKNYAKNNETIKIGVSGPLTGGAAKYGIAVKNSAKMAIDEINANGGLYGMKFEFMALDDEHKKENVTTTYSAMYENGMQISLGTVTTAPGLEFKELSKDDNVFVLTPSATGDDIVEYSNAYQMCFSDSNQGTASAEYFNENYIGKKVGVFYKADDEYSTGIFDKFMESIDKSFKDAGISTASFTGDGLDFSTQVNMLKDCDVIFLPIYTGPAAAFMTKGKGVVSNGAIYYGCDGLDGVEAEFGSWEEFMQIPQEVSFLSHFNSKAESGPAFDFVNKYNDLYDEEKEPVNQFGAAAYDCVYAIFEALKYAKEELGKEFDETTSPSDYCDSLTEVFNSEGFVFHGITGECEGDNKSNISWGIDGFVNKKAVKYEVKPAN